MKTVDCRGLACPQPVMETKKALDTSETKEVVVLVDNPTSRENVSRFAASQGYQVSMKDEKDHSAITIRRGDGGEREERPSPAESPPRKGIGVLHRLRIHGEGFGGIGGILMRAFLHTLGEADVKPEKIILVNSGVKLACEGSPALEDLQTVASQGVEILACGTCLNYFEVKEDLRAGRISNMYEILMTLSQAGKNRENLMVPQKVHLRLRAAPPPC